MTLPAPYPADTRAKGWRFEIDYEKVEQSSTWALAPAEVRPWLLMLWMTAWKQVPCGSLDNDDALIAARIGMPAKTFAKHREVLRRGWWLADDGRLYHDTIALRVADMLEYRRKEAERRGKNRSKTPTVPRDNGGTPPGQPQDSTESPGTGTSTGTLNSVPIGTGGAAADGKRVKTPAERRKSELWAGMKTLLVESGECPDLKSAGAVITKTITRYDEATALAAIDATLHAKPAGAIAYLEGACQQAIGARPNKQETLEAGNLDAARRFVESMNATQ